MIERFELCCSLEAVVQFGFPSGENFLSVLEISEAV
jgi:hypothetical protein